jgi:hypothetical protein
LFRLAVVIPPSQKFLLRHLAQLHRQPTCQLHLRKVLLQLKALLRQKALLQQILPLQQRNLLHRPRKRLLQKLPSKLIADLKSAKAARHEDRQPFFVAQTPADSVAQGQAAES